MPEEKSDSTAYAILILTVVIAIIGAPFAFNEYSKWQEREHLNELLNRPIIVERTPTFTVYYTNPTIRTPYPSPIPTPVPIIYHAITDGYWCRFTTMNIGKNPTDVTECYQFFSDGTFKWGYSPGYPMGKSPSCWAPNARCAYSYNSKGQYEVQGGYFFTLTSDTLIDPHNPPYYRWSSSGIP